jgi:hypothetical protein
MSIIEFEAKWVPKNIPSVPQETVKTLRERVQGTVETWGGTWGGVSVRGLPPIWPAVIVGF